MALGGGPRRCCVVASCMTLESHSTCLNFSFPSVKWCSLYPHLTGLWPGSKMATHVNHIVQWLAHRGLSGCSAGCYLLVYSTLDLPCAKPQQHWRCMDKGQAAPRGMWGLWVCLRTHLGTPTLPGTSPWPGSPVSPPPAQEWSTHSRGATGPQVLSCLSHCHHFASPI